MPVRVKICGVTSEADAHAAIAAGADALGFMFHESSPRHLSLTIAASIVRSLPPFVSKVGVFANAPARLIHETMATCGLDTVQLHGDEPPEFCRLFRPGQAIVKAFRIQDEQSIEALRDYADCCDAWLLDSFVAG